MEKKFEYTRVETPYYLRRDTYTGGEHYWIQLNENGDYDVMMELPEFYDENKIEFSGDYSSCVRCIENILAENVEYDLNL